MNRKKKTLDSLTTSAKRLFQSSAPFLLLKPFCKLKDHITLGDIQLRKPRVGSKNISMISTSIYGKNILH